MTTSLVATASVHVTAAAADYLQERLDSGTDDVVVAVREPDAPARALLSSLDRPAVVVPLPDLE